MQQQETIEQYLKRGGKVTTLPPAPDGGTQGFWTDNSADYTKKAELIQTVSWGELYEESDPEIDDPKYWKKLNERLDKALVKIEKSKIKQEKT